MLKISLYYSKWMFIIILHLNQRYGAVANRSVLRYRQAWRSIFPLKNCQTKPRACRLLTLFGSVV